MLKSLAIPDLNLYYMRAVQPSQTKPVIVAQSFPDPSRSNPPPGNGSFPLVPIVLTVVVTLMLVSLWSQKDKIIGGFKAWTEPEPDSDTIRSQEFAVDIEVSNIRTQDYLRANVQATIYVYIADTKEDNQKAKKFLVEEDSISTVAVEKAVKKRAETALRGSASKHTLDYLHTNRTEVGKEATTILGNCLNPLGLTVRDLVIGEIEESANYTADNYFDAKAVEARTKVIQPAILATRTEELKTEEAIRKQELDTEEKIRKQELEKGRDIRLKELEIGIELENQELTHQETSLKNLETLEKVEKRKIDHDLIIEKYQNEKEKELQEAIETSELALKKKLEIAELKDKEELESLKHKTEIEIQLNKLLQDTDLIEKNKTFRLKQATVNQEIETGEIAATISIISKEKERLETEIERAQAEQAVTTAIEKAQAERQKLQAEIAAESVENEAKTIERLAEAEGKRYHLIPATDAERTAKMVRELAPQLIENLPQVVEIAKALAPQAGILGDSNIYNFPNGNGEEINKLMLSTSGMLLIQSLLNGKLGDLLGKSLRSLNNDSNSGQDNSDG
ncbi:MULTISPECIES: SPFH domain-containing protein [unclassified Microcystis]|uniref:SPFH domain-containing protein n=1 Tax=unclassified Microcystis TaxID=2643300 RepID=UPI0022C58B3A|nr:SPFH domain-containing protein [Microcystis sp. LE19-195.1E]MCZ8250071.1 SPFH domain-containing protein [Microcystis sp. LE19-195.1E]